MAIGHVVAIAAVRMVIIEFSASWTSWARRVEY